MRDRRAGLAGGTASPTSQGSKTSGTKHLPGVWPGVAMLVIPGSGASRPFLRVLWFHRPFQVRLLRGASLAHTRDVPAYPPLGVGWSQACMLRVRRQGDRAHQSCATVPNAFPPCGFDVGLHSVSAELNGQVALGFNKVNYCGFNLRLFRSLFVSESKELEIRRTVL